MQWIKPKIKNEPSFYTKVHEYTILVDNKLMILNFERLQSEKKMDVIHIGCHLLFHDLTTA
jgi:hypothetical protein